MTNRELFLAKINMAIAGAGATLAHVTLNEWVAFATLIYIVMQAGLLVPKYILIIKGWFKKDV